MKKLLLASTLAVVLSQTLFAKEEVVAPEQSRFESLSKLTKVIGTVEKYYVDDIKLQEIVDKSLKGLMQELDAHSSYLDKKASKEMNVQTQGEFGGLGITVGMRDAALTVISPIDDTPAFKAGIKALDIILKIDETSTINMTLDEAVNLMRGKPKTDIVLTIVRKGELKPIEIKIQRDIIKIQSVFSKTIEKEDLLYLRIASFDANVTDDLAKIISENKDKKGFILDLRNNPGGLLSQAIGVVDLFVDKGIIVSQKGRNAEDEEKFEASSSNTKTKLYEVALFLQAKNENKASNITIPVLKELAEYQVALSNKNIDELNNLSMQGDFLLKEFAIFNKALLLSNEGKYEEAKTVLKLIPQTSKAFELSNLLNHYLLTK